MEYVRDKSRDIIEDVQSAIVSEIEDVLQNNDVGDIHIENDAVPLNGRASVRGDLPEDVDAYTVADINTRIRQSVEEPESIDWAEMPKRE
jgi:hypothetical protein